MSSIQHKKEAAVGSTFNQLQRAPVMDPLHGIGNLSYLQPENRGNGPPLSNVYLQHQTIGGATNRSVPPPLPPRQNASYRYPDRYRYSGINSYSGMNNLYNPYASRYSPGLYSSSLYSSPYSSHRMPYGHYGAPNEAYSSFLQMAEESTRPAFESIESVVHVVNSISMMLESTYGAVHSSYSAIIGVVDQFSRLKDHLAEMFSVLAMLRGLQWLCMKVLYLLGLRKTNPVVEAAWNTAREAAVSGGYPGPETQGSAWPFLMFLSLVIGAPWLMFKLLSKNVAKKTFDPNMWLMSNGKRMMVFGAYDFAATQPGELSFRAGEKLFLSPRDIEGDGLRSKHWLFVLNERDESGLVPTNYLLLSSNYRAKPRISTTTASEARRYLSANSAVPGLNSYSQNLASSDSVVDDAASTQDQNDGISEMNSSTDKGAVSRPKLDSLKKHLIPPTEDHNDETSVMSSSTSKGAVSGPQLDNLKKDIILPTQDQNDGTSEMSSSTDREAVSARQLDGLEKNIIFPKDLDFGVVLNTVDPVERKNDTTE